jgi:hypothetical protein
MSRILMLFLVAGLAQMQEVQAAVHVETQKDVARRIAIDADRAANRGDAKGEKDARSVSGKARRAKTVERARQIEKNFNKDNFN